MINIMNSREKYGQNLRTEENFIREIGSINSTKFKE